MPTRLLPLPPPRPHYHRIEGVASRPTAQQLQQLQARQHRQVTLALGAETGTTTSYWGAQACVVDYVFYLMLFCFLPTCPYGTEKFIQPASGSTATDVWG